MNTERRTIEVGGLRVEYIRKDIRNLHIGVYPPNGRVRVAAPLRLDEEAVRLAVISRLAWIQRQRGEFSAQERQSEREMLTGESHYYRGRRYRLDVIEQAGPQRVELQGNSRIGLFVRPGRSREQREALLYTWYRACLREALAALLPKWEARLGVSIAELRIKRMKTHWGTCNSAARRIWLNTELAKKSPHCLEYILVHEMLHFFEQQHNARFGALMDRHLPMWRQYRDELNRAPLAHEDWHY